jgi:hypothetical protein
MYDHEKNVTKTVSQKQQIRGLSTLSPCLTSGPQSCSATSQLRALRQLCDHSVPQFPRPQNGGVRGCF